MSPSRFFTFPAPTLPYTFTAILQNIHSTTDCLLSASSNHIGSLSGHQVTIESLPLYSESDTVRIGCIQEGVQNHFSQGRDIELLALGQMLLDGKLV